MFDKSFKNSEQYFTVLQLLRIFHESIRDTSRILKALWEWFEIEHVRRYRERRPANWRTRSKKISQERERIWQEQIWGQHIVQERKFLERIEKKESEIRGFRDAVCPCGQRLFIFHHAY